MTPAHGWYRGASEIAHYVGAPGTRALCGKHPGTVRAETPVGRRCSGCVANGALRG